MSIRVEKYFTGQIPRIMFTPIYCADVAPYDVSRSLYGQTLYALSAPRSKRIAGKLNAN